MSTQLKTKHRAKVEHRQLGEGYVTVAFNYDTDNGQIHYALSFCSPLDQFSRKRGYTIAEGRLVTYRSNDIIRTDRLIDRGLAGSIPTTTAEPKKKAIIDSIMGIVTTRTLPDSQLRWVHSVTP